MFAELTAANAARPATAQRLVNGMKCPFISRHDEHIVRLNDRRGGKVWS
jgi:hypothetical protein